MKLMQVESTNVGMGEVGLSASLAIREAVAPSVPLRMASLFIVGMFLLFLFLLFLGSSQLPSVLKGCSTTSRQISMIIDKCFTPEQY